MVWVREVFLDIGKLFSYLNFQAAWASHQYATDNARPFINTFPKTPKLENT